MYSKTCQSGPKVNTIENNRFTLLNIYVLLYELICETFVYNMNGSKAVTMLYVWLVTCSLKTQTRRQYLHFTNYEVHQCQIFVYKVFNNQY